MDYFPLAISLKVAVIATFFAFFIGIGLAHTVVNMTRGKMIVDSIIILPMLLPPTVVGFFLLVIFGKNGAVGQFFRLFDITFVFNWAGGVIASAVMALPLMYRTTRGAFEQMDVNMIHAARTLGLSEFKIFWTIIIPLSKPGIIAGTVLAFARAMGEFGATIMIAGNIPGKTQTMSIAIYTAMQSGDRELAYKWSLIICAISFTMLIVLNHWSKSKYNITGKW